MLLSINTRENDIETPPATNEDEMMAIINNDWLQSVFACISNCKEKCDSLDNELQNKIDKLSNNNLLSEALSNRLHLHSHNYLNLDAKGKCWQFTHHSMKKMGLILQIIGGAHEDYLQ